MADEQNIPAPPSGSIVDAPPQAQSQGQPQGQPQSQSTGTIPPPPSGDIVDTPPSAPDYLSKTEDMISSAGDSVVNFAKNFKKTTIDPITDMASQTRAYYNKKSDEAGGGLGGALSGAAYTSNPLMMGGMNTLLEMSRHPKQAEQILKDAMKDPEHPLFKMAQGIVQSHMDTAEKTKGALAKMVAAVKRGDMDEAQYFESEAMGYGLATVVPVVGPAAARAGEAVGSGDISGGLGQGAGLIASVVGPHAVKEGVKGMLADVPQGIEAPASTTPTAPGILRPGVKTVGGQEIPVRAQGIPAKMAESVMTNSGKAKLQDFEINQTQRAVRQGVSNTVADAAGIEPSDTTGKSDAFGFGGARDAIQARSKPVFQAIDKASDGAFSAAQNEAALARSSTDYAGKKAYQAAIEKQNQIFDSIKALAGKGETPELSENALNQAKADWKRSIGMDELKDRFDKYVQPTPADLAKPGVPDVGYVNPSQFRNGITDAIQAGEFDKAGFSPDHIQALEDMGVELEKAKVKFNDTLTNLAKHLVGGGIGSGVGALAGGGLPGAFMGAGAEAGLSHILSKIMTSPKLVEAMTDGLKSGAPAATLSNRLWSMFKDDKGELTVPFTGAEETQKPTLDYKYDNSGKSNVQHSVVSTDEAGKKVGELVAQDTGKIGDAVTVRSNQIYDKANRGKGYGKAQLERLIDETAKNPETKYLHSDSSTTGDARHVWESMERNYPDAVSKKVVGKGASARPMWTVDLDKIRGKNPLDELNVNHDSVAEAHNANGGATFNPIKGDLSGKEAYPVATHPELGQILDGEKVTPEQLKAFTDDPRRAKILKSNPDASVGSWANDGKTYLDIVDTPADLEKAKALGVKNNQKAIFDLKNMQEIPTGGTGEIPTGRVGQRRPSAAGSEAGHNPDLNLGMDVVKQAGAEKPKYLQSLADRVAEYPSMKFTPEGAEDSFNPDELAKLNPEKTVNDFVKQAADNIEWLHNQTPKHIREISKQWYDSAHEMTKKQADEYGISHPQAAAVTAVLSPQNPWDNNISLAKRVLDVWKNKQNFKWSPEMNKKAAELYNQSPAIAEFSDMIRGKTLSQLHDANPDVESAMKALWTRVYDEAHNPRTFERWAPDGSSRGIARNESGSPSNSSWFSLLPISKALSVLEDGSMDNIHEQLGGSHKVRNFYNNIIDPNSKMGDTTIDTHAVGVAHMSPFSGEDAEVKHNFGGTKNAAHGLVGTYPLYAEAYKVAADRLGIQPRQLQSITWEGIRSLFKNKTPELRSAVRDIWKEHQDGDITIDDARKRIVKAAGGFHPTDWESDLGSNAEVGAPENTGELSRVGVPKEKPQADSGTGSGTPRGVSATRTQAKGETKGVYDLISKGAPEPKFDWSKTRSVGNGEADAFTRIKEKLFPGKRELSLSEIGQVASEAAKMAKEAGPNKTTK